MKIGHVASERTSSWPILDQTVGWEKKKRAEKKEEEKERFLEHFLSKFSDNRTGGFRRSKRRSSFSRKGFRIETEVGEF